MYRYESLEYLHSRYQKRLLTIIKAISETFNICLLLNNYCINNVHRVAEKNCHFKELAETMLPHASCGYFNITINVDEIVKQKDIGLVRAEQKNE